MLPLVTLTENVNLDQKLQTGTATSLLEQNEIKYLADGRVQIIRNASDDTFNLEIPAYANTSHRDYLETPYVNLNNKIEISGKSAILGQLKHNNTTSNDSWKVHHTLLNNSSFRDINILAIGDDMMNSNVSGGVEFPSRRWVTYFDFNNIHKDVETSFSNIVELKTIKSLSFGAQQNEHTSITERGLPSYSPIFTKRSDSDITRTYTHLFVKPIEPDRFHGNEAVAEIYGYADDGKDMTEADYSIKDATMKSSSLGNEKLSLDFEKYTGEKKYLESGLPQYLLGTLKVTDPTYYDYSSGTTKIGFAAHSVVGEYVPYGFKGDYTREIDLTLNSAFKNMKIMFSKHMDQALLDPSEGLVKLQVRVDNTPKKTTFKTFTPEDIEIIRSRKLDLIGLKRLAEE